MRHLHWYIIALPFLLNYGKQFVVSLFSYLRSTLLTSTHFPGMFFPKNSILVILYIKFSIIIFGLHCCKAEYSFSLSSLTCQQLFNSSLVNFRNSCRAHLQPVSFHLFSALCFSSCQHSACPRWQCLYVGLYDDRCPVLNLFDLSDQIIGTWRRYLSPTFELLLERLLSWFPDTFLGSFS